MKTLNGFSLKQSASGDLQIFPRFSASSSKDSKEEMLPVCQKFVDAFLQASSSGVQNMVPGNEKLLQKTCHWVFSQNGFVWKYRTPKKLMATRC